MVKCLKTISGKHLWEMRTIRNNDVQRNVFWEVIVPACILCGLIDDRKVELPKNEPVKIKWKNKE